MAEEKIEKGAYYTWEVMHREAKKRGMALTRHRHIAHGNIDGRIIISTIGAFIKMLNNERGWDLTENEVDLVRRYLKETGNVWTLSKVEQYKYRIFIAEEWEERVIKKSIPEKKKDKMTAQDLGEDRQPSEVTYKCVKCDPPTTWGSQSALYGHSAVHKERTKPKPKKIGEPTMDDDDPNRVIYAEGFDPNRNTFDEWWVEARDVVGGDDFVEALPIHQDALQEAVTNIVAEALDRGNAPPRQVLPQILDKVNHLPCAQCGEPVIDREPNRHIATAIIACQEGPVSSPKKIVTPLTQRQINLLQVLADRGGSIHESKGYAANVWADLAGEPINYISGSQGRLIDRGLITAERKSKNHRRTYSYTLTGEGWKHVSREKEQVEKVTKEETKSGPERAKSADTYDQDLIEMISDRLSVLPQIQEVIDNVNAGKTTPLTALGEIEEILR